MQWVPRAFLGSVTTPVVTTELRGSVTVADVERWAARLRGDVAALPEGTRFRLLLDLTGYEPADIAAHKAMRLVVPRLLADHGMRPAFADLFPEDEAPVVRAEQGVVVEAFANVHHDPEKMRRYEELIATPTQRFFTSRGDAEAWLAGLPTGPQPGDAASFAG